METEACTSWVNVPEAPLSVNDEVRTHTSGLTPSSGHPELHLLSPTRTGESQSGMKMEMMEGKRNAMADAKINYKTFTFKMRSGNSSKQAPTKREKLSRHWDRGAERVGIFE